MWYGCGGPTYPTAGNKLTEAKVAKAKVITVTPTLEAAILADNDVFFNSVEVPLFARIPGGASKLVTVIFHDADDQAIEMDLIFSDTSITLGTLNAAVSVADADARKIIGGISLVPANTQLDIVNGTFHQWPGPIGAHPGGGLLMQAATGQTSIWCSGIVRSGTPDFTADGARIKIGIEQY